MRKTYGLLAAASIFLLDACSPVLSPHAYLEYRACIRVRPGMSEQDVIALMGQPQSSSAHSPDERWLEYREEFGASGPIEIIMEKKGAGFVVQATACEGLG